jgi:hypothetical protein
MPGRTFSGPVIAPSIAGVDRFYRRIGVEEAISASVISRDDVTAPVVVFGYVDQCATTNAAVFFRIGTLPG